MLTSLLAVQNFLTKDKVRCRAIVGLVKDDCYVCYLKKRTSTTFEIKKDVFDTPVVQGSEILAIRGHNSVEVIHTKQYQLF